MHNKIATSKDIPEGMILKGPQYNDSVVEFYANLAKAVLQAHFCPSEIKMGALAAYEGDSEYGARIGVVKKLMLATLARDDVEYSLDGVANALADQSTQPAWWQTGHALAWEKALSLEDRRSLAGIYRDMADVSGQVWADFGRQTPKGIRAIVEPHVYFSGKWNRSGRNLTFPDERVRKQGDALQQLVQRIWNYGILPDTPAPLNDDELAPVYFKASPLRIGYIVEG